MAVSINYNTEFLAEKARERDQAKFDVMVLEELGNAGRHRDVEIEKRIAVLYVLSQRAQCNGFRFERFSDLLEQRDLIFEYAEDHRCEDGRCTVIQTPQGQAMTYAITGEQIVATGSVWVCCSTGAVHICSGTDPCDKTTIDRKCRTEGYSCSVTGLYKGAMFSRIPAYDKERLIGYATLGRLEKAEESRLAKKMDKGGDYCDYGNVSDDDEPFYGSEMPTDAGAEDDKPGVENDIVSKALRAAKRKLDAVERAVQPLQPPQPRQPPKRRTPLPKKPATAEERSTALLRGLQEKQATASTIVRVLLARSTQVALYNTRMRRLAAEASQHVCAAKRNARRDLTTIECTALWTAYMQNNAPPRPHIGPELNYNAYANSVVELWVLASTSPYAQQGSGPKQKPLNFEKMAVAFLYTASRGGLRVTCSLPEEALRACGAHESAPELFAIVADFQVQAISPDVSLARYLPRDRDAVEVRNYARSALPITPKTIFSGVKLLKTCVNSIYDGLAKDTLAQLETADDVRAVLQAYFDACIAKKLTPTYERGL